jgi:hypothetical protein
VQLFLQNTINGDVGGQKSGVFADTLKKLHKNDYNKEID